MTAENQDKFLYFAFGSNLLRERIQLSNPSASFVQVAKLDNYKLIFDSQTDVDKSTWHGAPATIIEEEGAHVWGTVWQMNRTDIESLDVQEGVAQLVYKPIQVKVQTIAGETLECRSYQLVKLRHVDPRPSPQYLRVIINGAMMCGLPADYIDMLKKVETNGYSGCVEVMEQIEEKVKLIY